MTETSETTGAKYPVLPLRDIVVFPHMIVPLFVGREKSVRALESAMQIGKQIVLVTQKSPQQDDPTPGDLYDIGTLGVVLQLLKLPDGTVKVLVEGQSRIRVTSYTDKAEYFEAYATGVASAQVSGDSASVLMRTCVAQFEQYVKLNKKIPPEIISSVSQIEDPEKLADTVASYLSLKIPERQKLLETADVAQRLEKIFGHMEGEIGVLEVEKRVRGRVKRQMEKTQREYYLNEQMKAIQKELNEGEEGGDELAELEDKIKKARMSKEAAAKCEAELKKLRQMGPMSAEATVVRNYLDWMVSLPWSKRSKTSKDLKIGEFVAALFAFVQLFLDGLHLLVEVILALGLLHLALDAAAHALFDFEHADLAFHVAEDLLQPLGDVRRLQKLLTLGDFQRQVGGHRIRQLLGILDLADRGNDLRRNLLVQLHVLLELRGAGAHQHRRRIAADRRLGHGGRIGLEIIRLVGVGRDPDAVLPLDQHLDRAVRQFEQLQHHAERADVVKVARRRVVLLRRLLRDQHDLLAVLHRAFERVHRLLPPDEQRHNHMRKNHDVPQGQYRVLCACCVLCFCHVLP
ncbi:MAG: LON peptidase substrate-binding domain-containing protein, partial [Alphaproteobacteria bacterium]|nr:LON peptidase substrate-binding domain-containing protein [Alphaproteobacteria bacterium]